MTKIPNNEQVAMIVMKPRAYTKCQIGQDWFLNCFKVLFKPNKCYPDYMEVQSYISKNIEGKEMNIEVAAYALKKYLEQYEPLSVVVIDHITNCNTHFDVDVIIK